MTAESAAGRRAPRWLRAVPSARVRILGWLLLVMAVALLAVVVATRVVLLREVAARTTLDLTQELEEFAEFVGTARDPATGGPFSSTTELLALHLQRQYPAEGEVLFGYTDVLLRQDRGGAGAVADDTAVVRAVVRSPESSGAVATAEGELRWAKQVAVAEGGGPDGTFVVGVLVDRERAAVAGTVQVIAAVSAVALVVTAGVAWVVAGQILAPVRLVRRTAAEISTDDLSRRIPTRGRDDVAQLATTFNGMLDRLEHAFGTQRQFVDDASHELRTPITVVRGHLELMGDDAEEREETVRLVTDELDRMNRIVEDLLVLAKADRPDFVRPATTDLAELTNDLEAKVRALGARRWVLESCGEGHVQLDGQRVTQAVLQLAQNAVQHTRTGDAVRLGSRHHDGVTSIWVTDPGPGVDPQDREAIFGRFTRGSRPAAPVGSDPTPGSTSGAGLGLSIVAAIAAAHGGRVELTSDPGRATTFTLVLPGAGEPG